ncbi:phosphoserine phosphatase serb [Aulographum hederae CBS 113979]|uniref:phosphoserine phosphatase n=1 Tax=Aulographum hederae CBS 113979 TaxID=1176131 RepID=A0A6G1GLQ0_9PEZI|nr:phosphoserine phosphatase serb [Aulographum hederae CBS 113979]
MRSACRQPDADERTHVTLISPRLFGRDRPSQRRESRARTHSIQIILQSHPLHLAHRLPGLAVFDMDSTLIQQEVIDEIAASLGPEFAEAVSAITARAMNGELDFEESLRERCQLLKGVKGGIWTELRERITLTPGARELVGCLKSLGWKTAVLSGGFQPMADWLKEEIGLDFAHANHLVVSEDGKSLTGELEGDIVHAERKRELVVKIAEREGVQLGKTVCVGDGANDLLMMGVAGLGVAFNAKEKVQVAAPTRLNADSLMDVMYLLGYSQDEQAEILKR